MARATSLAPADPTAAPPDHLVDRWVSDLRRIVVGGQVEILAQVGDYLIEHVYRGEADARSRRSGKPASIERLAERAEEFGMTAGGLTRAVPIALQVRALGKTLAFRLGVRQHRALLPVKDQTEKKRLALAAVEEGWTAGELQRQVRRAQDPHPGGRPPGPEIRRVVNRAYDVLQGIKIADLQSGLAALDAAEAQELLTRVNAMQVTLERIERLVTKAAVKK